MSLHYLGIAHFPVLHRQFSSPTSLRARERLESPTQDITQDNKDVLIERLNDLVLRLSKSTFLENSTVDAVHAGVDKIELLLDSGEKPHLESVNLESRQPKEIREDIFWKTPLTPTKNIRMQFPENTFNTSSLSTHRPEITLARVDEIAKAAEDLSLKLATTVSELQTRMQDSNVS